MGKPLYTNKRQLKTLIRKYDKLIKAAENPTTPSADMDKAVAMLAQQQRTISVVTGICNAALQTNTGSRNGNRELRQLATTILINLT